MFGTNGNLLSLQLEGSPGNMNIGLVKEGFASCEQCIQNIVKTATQRFTRAGATVEDISIPVHSGQGTCIVIDIFRLLILLMEQEDETHSVYEVI